MTDKTVKIYEILYLENRIPRIEKYPIRLAGKTADKKDKTSEAVIIWMTETNKQNRNKTRNL